MPIEKKNALSAGTASLIRRTNRYLQQMSALCEQVLSLPDWHQEEMKPWQKEVADHFYLIEKQATAAMRDLKGVRLPASRETRHVPALYAIAREYLKRDICDEEKTADFFRQIGESRQLRLKELDYFLPVATLCCVCQIGDILRQGGEEQTKQIARLIEKLQFFTEMDFADLIESVSLVEQLLLSDPAGVYAHMDRDSRAYYRQKVGTMAQYAGVSEEQMARDVLAASAEAKEERKRHVGYYILCEPLAKNGRVKPSSRQYTSFLFLAAGIIALAAGLMLGSAAAFLLALFPLFELVKTLCDWALMQIYAPDKLPRLDFHKSGIPEDCAGTVVTSVLLSSKQSCREAAERLKENYLRNRDEALSFVLLADFKGGAAENQAEDGFLASCIKEEIMALCAKYGERFCVLLRRRSYAPSEDAYMGWERKRGAITELVRLIKGEEHTFRYQFGALGRVKKSKYLIALDADTELLMDSARRMIEAMAHPLAQPVIDGEKGIVAAGYGVMVPIVNTDLASANKSLFARIMAGYGGVSTYDALVSSTYQDVFGVSIFSGKGIVDIDAYYRLLNHRFPEGQVLSHDILEGAFLRCGLLSDVAVCDEYPSTPAAFYKRLERWVRGDTQNLYYLKKTMNNEAGEKEENPLSHLSRFQIADNLRRALTPAMSLIALWIAAFVPLAAGSGVYLWVLVLLSVAASDLIGMAKGLFAGGIGSVFIRYFSKTMHFIPMAIYGALVKFALLPYAGYTGALAVGRALWRMFHSHKKLLAWVTAAQTGKAGQSFLADVRSMWLCLVSGIALCLFAHSWIWSVTGLIHLLAPLGAYALGMPERRGKTALSEKERRQLLEYQRAMWRYFEDFAGEEHSYLPADNYQQAPIGRVAYRTSPTNIGFMLLCFLGARDLEFITSETLYERVSRSIGSVEKLAKWHGHLYNWYDTRNCAVLAPEYISTVDSANFCACLVALYHGLGEYEREAEKMPALRKRVRRLIDQTDFAPLFDEKKDLFYIGYDKREEAYAKSHYDLLMSEARLASYFAVARRQVPKSHWSALGRAMRSADGHMGALAWTGTMFEYFMPHLLLPVYDNSFLYESLCFALSCQKIQDSPWGYSESAFYAFDQMLNYQYQAFGVRALALKTDLEGERVVSPYSTFLTLGLGVHAQMKNLKTLQKLGVYGKYGFYEAVDLSKKRAGGGRAVVKSFMSHHIGMSFLAVVNILEDHIMQKRFMADDEMRSAAELLKEKVPAPSGLYSARKQKHSQDKPSLFHTSEEVVCDDPMVADLHAHLLTNGQALHVLTDIGVSAFYENGTSLTRMRRDFLGAPKGVFAFLAIEGKLYSLLKAPLYQDDCHYSAEFGAKRALYRMEREDLCAELSIVMHEDFTCERLDLKVQRGKKRIKDAFFILYTEPVLEAAEDEIAHPAFANLFVRAREEREQGCVIFSRKHRGEGASFFAVGGLTPRRGWQALSSREQIFAACRRGGDFSAIHRASWDDGVLKTPLDPAAAIRIPLTLEDKENDHVALFTCFAHTAGDLKLELHIAEKKPYGEFLEQAKQMRDNLKRICFATEVQLTLAEHLLPYAYWSLPANGEKQLPLEDVSLGDIWGLGLSGRLPLFYFTVSGKEGCMRLGDYLKAFKILRTAGVKADLVVGYTCFEDGHICYEIEKQIKSLEITHLSGAEGGIHLVNLDEKGERIQKALAGISVYYLALDQAALEKEKQRPERDGILHILPSEALKPALLPDETDLSVYGGRFAQGGFYTEAQPLCVRPPWYHILTNGRLSTALSDTSLGYTFADNARENKLTAWNNDIIADNLSERLLCLNEEQAYDLVLGSSAFFEAGGARYHSVNRQIESEIFVHIPQEENVKVVDIVLKSGAKTDRELRLCYVIRPLLAVSEEGMDRMISYRDERGALIFTNPFAVNFHGYGVLACDGADSDFTCDPASLYTGGWSSRQVSCKGAECIALSAKVYLKAEAGTRLRFVLGYGEKEEIDRLLSQFMDKNGGSEVACDGKQFGGVSADEEKPGEDKGMRREAAARPGSEAYEKTVAYWRRVSAPVRITTPEKELDVYFNHWALYQSAACRFLARTGYYQCGGAYGFRDQLQDTTALVYAFPALCRTHLLRSAAHQFTGGDVLHWWHPFAETGGEDKGVRTRYSDDLLFLPYALAQYVRVSGDAAILHKQIPYLEGRELDEEERERYFTPGVSTKAESMYYHALRAIERARRFGDHGLCLMGGGDWNDGMNRIGVEGRGESVWLTLFFAHVLECFIPLCDLMGDEKRKEDYQLLAQVLKQAVEETCWEQDRYLRAFWDDGDKLGKKDGEACQIDAIVQGFAALDQLDGERVALALDAAERELFDREYRLCRLFAPAFVNPKKYPGYIADYPAGIRENGGQYTHGALWLALGMFAAGKTAQGMEILRFANPVCHSTEEKIARVYRTEPYMMAADIYDNPEHRGRGGWTLYTGAAAWFYRIVLERVLGLEKEGNVLSLHPAIPEDWDGFTLTCSFAEGEAEIACQRISSEKRGLYIDGGKAPDDKLYLDARKKQAVYYLPAKKA